MEGTKITWSVGQSAATITENGQAYVIKDLDKDGHISKDEIKAAMKDKDLDRASTTLLKIFQAMGQSRNEKGKSLKTIKENLSEMSTDNSSIEGILRNREKRAAAEKEKRNELKAKYAKIQQEINIYKQAVAQYKNSASQQKQMLLMQQMFGGGYGCSCGNNMMNPFGMSNPFGGMMQFGGMLPFQNPFASYNSGIPSRAELEELGNLINADIDAFKAELEEAGISEDELIKDKGQLKLELKPETIIEQVESDETPETTEKPKFIETPKPLEPPKFLETPKAPETPKTPKVPEAPKAPEATKTPEQIRHDALMLRQGKNIAKTLHTEITDTVFDNDIADPALDQISGDNVMYVLSEYKKLSNNKDLWAALKDEYSTVKLKKGRFDHIVKALTAKAQSVGIDTETDPTFTNFLDTYAREYGKTGMFDGDCRETKVWRRFKEAVALIETKSQS